MAKNKKKSGDGYAIARKEYERIRKMDHQQMNSFLTNVFLNGYKKGAEQAEGLNPEQTKAAIMSVKGIGEKKAADIMEALINADKERKGLTDGE